MMLGLVYGVKHPLEFGKALINWKDLSQVIKTTNIAYSLAHTDTKLIFNAKTIIGVKWEDKVILILLTHLHYILKQNLQISLFSPPPTQGNYAKWAGTLAPTVAAAFFSGGASGGLKGAEAAAGASRAGMCNTVSVVYVRVCLSCLV